MYRIVNAQDYDLETLLGDEVPTEALLETAEDRRWAGRAARGIVLGHQPVLGKDGKPITHVLVLSYPDAAEPGAPAQHPALVWHCVNHTTIRAVDRAGNAFKIRRHSRDNTFALERNGEAVGAPQGGPKGRQALKQQAQALAELPPPTGRPALVISYDAARARGSRFASGRPRNISRLLCPNWPNCQSKSNPWLFFRSESTRRGQTEPQVCTLCRRKHASQRHRDACRDMNAAYRNKLREEVDR